ncbi:hypothetical protein RD792_000765 [Penstemon davidsonii]|uniref:GOLD domain-containing protein n=1 Tax=Penstemon davidsonii TaxID=160366 RepID=A0ABR0DMS3_9LAMI|nr:hypothetical protein RD792_000765 [Penstemon davidsonii]
MKLVWAISLWTFLLVVEVPTARGLWMDLPASGAKCISEEIHNHVVVMADYYTFIGEEYVHDNNTIISPTVSIKVTSPHGKELFHKEKTDHGQFGFTATEAGSYQACMEIVGDGHKGKKVSFGIDWKTGIAAKDWESVARKEKIQGLELELKKLEESVHAIHDSLNNLMDK